jgi:hypothetical protein
MTQQCLLKVSASPSFTGHRHQLQFSTTVIITYHSLSARFDSMSSGNNPMRNSGHVEDASNLVTP